MDRLHSCSTITIGLMRKLLVHVVRDAFYVRFGPNIYIAYVTSVCYRTSFTLIDVGWISITVRLPLFLKRR